MKGIILAAGNGSRLRPLTEGISKHMLPVFDKPMIYYPLSILMMAGIKDVLIITNPQHLESYKSLLNDGSEFGISIKYETQTTASGIADAFLIGENFIGDDTVCLILGDNLFFGEGLIQIIQNATKLTDGAQIIAKKVNKPENFGVVEFDENLNVISIEEKPSFPKSKFIITGLYFYDNSVVQKAKKLQPSTRGEKEISDINNMYLNQNKLKVELLGRGAIWMDMGTIEDYFKANQLIASIETTRDHKVACLEEIALNNGDVTTTFLKTRLSKYENTQYGRYLSNLIEHATSAKVATRN